MTTHGPEVDVLVSRYLAGCPTQPCPEQHTLPDPGDATAGDGRVATAR